METQDNNSGNNRFIQGQFIPYSKQEETEKERLLMNMKMPDIEKFKMFCKMMRIGKMLAGAKITHYRPS